MPPAPAPITRTRGCHRSGGTTGGCAPVTDALLTVRRCSGWCVPGCRRSSAPSRYRLSVRYLWWRRSASGYVRCRRSTMPAGGNLDDAEDGVRDYDVIVIGSGFGGSTAALRLREKGYRVAVLEAGRRFRDDELPRTSWDLRRYLWAPQL